MPQTLIQILGWIEHCQREHPGQGTVVPTWLCSMDAVREAEMDGYIEEIGRQSMIPRLGQSAIIYGMTEKGRVKFYTSLPRVGEPFAGLPEKYQAS